jgi:hypothetical protein
MLNLLADVHPASDSGVIPPFKCSLVTVFLSFPVVLLITHVADGCYYIDQNEVLCQVIECKPLKHHSLLSFRNKGFILLKLQSEYRCFIPLSYLTRSSVIVAFYLFYSSHCGVLVDGTLLEPKYRVRNCPLAPESLTDCGNVHTKMGFTKNTPLHADDFSFCFPLQHKQIINHYATYQSLARCLNGQQPPRSLQESFQSASNASTKPMPS